MKIKINVTEEIIQTAREKIAQDDTNYACDCPIALAVKPFIKEEFKVFVGFTCCFIKKDEEILKEINLPGRAYNLRYDFDDRTRGKIVSPTEFELDIPEEYLKC